MDDGVILPTDKLQEVIQIIVLRRTDNENRRLPVRCRDAYSLATVVLLARPNVGESLVFAGEVDVHASAAGVQHRGDVQIRAEIEALVADSLGEDRKSVV